MLSIGPTFRGFNDTGPSQETDPLQTSAWPKNYNPNFSTVIGYNRNNNGGISPIIRPRPPMMNTGPSRNFNPMVGSGTYRGVTGGGNPYGSSGITGGMYSNPGSIGSGGNNPDYSGTYGYGGYTGQMYGQTPNWGGFTPTIGRGGTPPSLGGNLWNTYSNLYNQGGGMARNPYQGGMGGMQGGYGGGMNRPGMMQGGMGQNGMGGGLNRGNTFSNLYY